MEFAAKPGRHDVIAQQVDTTSFEPVFAVTDRGRVLSVRAKDIPEMVRGSRGASVTEMFALGRGEKVVGMVPNAEVPVAVITRSGTAKRLEAASLAATRSGNPIIKLKDTDRVVAAFAAPDDAEVALVASDGQVLRTAASGISIQGPGAGGVAGMKLRNGAWVVAAGPVEFGSIVVVVTDEGTAKVTDTAEVPAKGRATGGVRVLKLKGFETTLAYAWVGKNSQLGAIVAEADDPRKADPTPVELNLETTRRDGPAVDLGHRILALGEYRFR